MYCAKHYFRERRDGRSVAVRLTPEPTNPYDSHEIAGCWRIFGYVVKELSDYVLDAINRGEIVRVEFSWIKYKIIRARILHCYKCHQEWHMATTCTFSTGHFVSLTVTTM